MSIFLSAEDNIFPYIFLGTYSKEALWSSIASSNNIPRNIYGKILSSADRKVEIKNYLISSIFFGITDINKMNKDEKKLKQAIKEVGYSNVYVEYEGNIVNILVSKKDANKSDAVTIVKLAYEKLGNSYIPSVSFKA